MYFRNLVSGVAIVMLAAAGSVSANDNKHRPGAESIINDDATRATVVLTCNNTSKRCTKNVAFSAGSFHYVTFVSCYARMPANGTLTEAFAATGAYTIDLGLQWQRKHGTITRYNMGAQTQFPVAGGSTMSLNVWYDGTTAPQEAYCLITAEIFTNPPAQPNQ
jgi:hypothetical protein